MTTAMIWMLVGAAAGGVSGIFVHGLLGCLNCFCSFDELFNTVGNWSVLNTMMLCAICGAVVGFIYGKCLADEEIEKQKQKELENARRKKQEESENRAKQIKWYATVVIDNCKDKKKGIKPLISTTYNTETTMNRIIDVLTEMAEVQGNIDAMVEVIKQGEGEDKNENSQMQ